MYQFTDEEREALWKAQEEANRKYQENYNKNVKKTHKKINKVGKFPKFISIIYILTLIVFFLALLILNVIPFKQLIMLFGALAFLSLLLEVFLRNKHIGKGVRGFASFIAIVLIIGYSTVSAYAMQTLSFLYATTVDNENKVASVSENPFNVCITGIDTYGDINEQGRSDVNMIVTVNPQTHQILLTSIPRDYEVYLNEFDAMDKITHTGFYGVKSTLDAEEELLKTTMNYYVKINFSTVENFIDSIGGVDVYSEDEFVPVKMKDWTVQEGMNHMNGKQALAFARERKAFITGDHQRVKNQQAVFEAIIKKATSKRTMAFNYSKILYSLKDNFEMNMSSAEIRSLVKLQLMDDPDWKIYKNSLTGGDATKSTYTSGYCYVMTQDYQSIENAETLINAVLEGQSLAKDDDGEVFVKE